MCGQEYPCFVRPRQEARKETLLALRSFSRPLCEPWYADCRQYTSTAAFPLLFSHLFASDARTAGIFSPGWTWFSPAQSNPINRLNR